MSRFTWKSGTTGQAFDSAGVRLTSLGLRIMAERADAVHAQLQVTSQAWGRGSVWIGTSKKMIHMYRTEIRVKGKIYPNWSEWFGELQM
jgi:hypothetical protein